jgi:flagellar motor switch protein FliM
VHDTDLSYTGEGRAEHPPLFESVSPFAASGISTARILNRGDDPPPGEPSGNAGDARTTSPTGESTGNAGTTAADTPHSAGTTAPVEDELDALAELGEDRETGIVPFSFGGTPPIDADVEARLRSLHERLATAIASDLSIYLGVKTEVSVTSIGTVRVAGYRQAVAGSAFFAAVDIDPIGRRAYWEWTAPVAFALIERQLGGGGTFDTDARDPTATEARLFRRLADRLSESLALAHGGPGSSARVDLRTDHLKIELGQPADALIHVAMEVAIGEGRGAFSLAYPASSWHRDDAPEDAPPHVRRAMEEALAGADTELRAELGSTTLTLGEIASLDRGDVIQLRRKMDEEIDLVVGHRVRFRGEPGRAGTMLAVRVTRIAGEEQ